MQMTWSATNGGYLLEHQTLTGYAGGSAVSVIQSTVEGSTIQLVQQPGTFMRFARNAHSAAAKAACLLLPTVAEAALTGCWVEGAVWTGETLVLGVATVTPLMTLPAIGAYLMGWGLWTHATVQLGRCLGHRKF